jgi:hydroxyacylglutathione hydrolase
MEIVPGIHRVDNVEGNCYLLVEKHLVLIDTGLPWQTEKILDYISHKLNRQPSELETIILTHCDIDHAGNAKELRRITGAKIAVHSIEADYVAGRKLRLGPSRFRWDIDIVYRALAKFMVFIRIQPFEPDILLEDDGEVESLRVIHVPGHTAGSIALYEPMSSLMFSGDTMIYTGKQIHGSPDRVTMNRKAAAESYKKLATFDFDILLGGHGPPLFPEASKRARTLYVPRVRDR